jgi:two-component system LytT family response regulator
MSLARRYRTILVEDERLARRDLARHLAAFPAVEIVGEAESAAGAETLVAQARPELIFLDVQLPDRSGFDLLSSLPVGLKVIFVTAFERYALRAFRVNALDYLLKPVEHERLAEALQRLEPRSDLPAEAPPPLALQDRYYAAVGNFRGFIAVRTIRRLEGAGNYSVVHTTDGRNFQVKQSLHTWERRLPAEHFMRISRNEIVQLGLIARLMPGLQDGFELELTGETVARAVSRPACAELRRRMTQLVKA